MNKTQLFPLVMGVIIGAASVLFVQWSAVTAQGDPAKAIYQIAPVPQASAVVWRLNKITGELELCYAANYSEWIRDKTGLSGQCAAMPAPSI